MFLRIVICHFYICKQNIVKKILLVFLHAIKLNLFYELCKLYEICKLYELCNVCEVCRFHKLFDLFQCYELNR